MSTYVLSTDGKVLNNSSEEIKVERLLDDVLLAAHKDLINNFIPSIVSDKVSNLTFSDSTLYDNNITSVSNQFKYETYKGTVIGKDEKLYPTAFGENMVATEGGAQKKQLNFYKPYNSVFDLNLNELKNLDGKNVEGIQIFADEMQLNHLGAPQIYIEPDLLDDNISNVFLSYADIFIASLIPITAISLIQSLLQAAQDGPSDPFGIMPKMGKDSVLPDRLGKYITYIRFDERNSPVLAPLGNIIIDALVSFLNIIEKLTGFPKMKVGKHVLGVAQKLIGNVISFLLGYVFYLLPGFKLNSFDLGFSWQQAGIFLTTLLQDVLGAVTRVDSSRHILNMLNRKIIMNKYFHEEILPKAKTTTGANGNEYDYLGKSLIKFSQFFYKFVSERVAAGDKIFGTLLNDMQKKRKFSFAVQKVREIPLVSADEGNQIGPIPIGSSILTGSNSTNDASQKQLNNLDRSIYSLTTLIKSSHPNANSFFDYHNALIEQNEKMMGVHKDSNGKYAKRLNQEHVKKLERIIDSDYMPFSIQDLRTNELFRFHAFLESFSDTFNVNWDDAGAGFGRMDPIKIYKSTTRSISVDFWLISMNEEDFHNMWWMLNRIIALIYPQWSKPVPGNINNQLHAGMDAVPDSDGSNTGKKGLKFSQPFTQIPTASPVIRLKLGDLFTSNYSKNNLAKIFGFETDPNINSDNLAKKENITIQKIIAAIQSSPDISTNDTSTTTFRKSATYFGHGITSRDKIKSEIDWFEKDSDIYNLITQNSDAESVNLTADNTTNETDNFELSQQISNENNNAIYWESVPAFNNNNQADNRKTGWVPSDIKKGDKFYKMVYYIFDIKGDKNNNKLIIAMSIEIKATSEVKPQLPALTLDQIMLNSYKGVLRKVFNYPDQFESIRNIETFMQSTTIDGKINNPVVKAFESTMGEGLAGTIQTFGVNFDQSIPWEITKGNRAPMGVKITFTMSVIHDILPGLDHNGLMRAPTYRVGSVNRNLFGDSVYNDKIDILPGKNYEFTLEERNVNGATSTAQANEVKVNTQNTPGDTAATTQSPTI